MALSCSTGVWTAPRVIAFAARISVCRGIETIVTGTGAFAGAAFRLRVRAVAATTVSG